MRHGKRSVVDVELSLLDVVLGGRTDPLGVDLGCCVRRPSASRGFGADRDTISVILLPAASTRLQRGFDADFMLFILFWDVHMLHKMKHSASPHLER